MIQIIKRIFSAYVFRNAMKQFGSISFDKLVLYSTIGITIVAIIVIIRKMMEKRIVISDVLCGIVLSIYASVIIQLTLVCRESGTRIGIELDLFHGLTSGSSHFRALMLAYVLLNCLLFMPYGFALSLFSFINEKGKNIQMITVTLLSFMSSMVIECLQLITQRGYWEVQDLVSNTLGGMLGWVLFYMIYQLGRKIKRRKRENIEC